jgi:adenylate kinase
MKFTQVIVMLGQPGSGKGTQGKLVAQALGYAYFSMGACLREYAGGSDDAAREVKNLIDAGRIIPDNLIRKIFFDKIGSFPKVGGLVLDGFPRDVDQLKIFHEFLTQHDIKKVKVVKLKVPREKLIARIMNRSEVRNDNNLPVINTRFQEYDEKTQPLVEYFKNNHELIVVNGDRPIQEVHAEIMQKINGEAK